MRTILSKFLLGIAMFGLALMVASLFLQVISREFRWAVDWTEELGRFAFISMVFVATAYGTMKRSHLSVTVFSDLMILRFGPRPIHILHTAITLGFAGLMIYFSAQNFVDGLRYPNISPAIGFNQNILFLPMCIGFIIIFLLHLRDLSTLILKGSLDE